MQILVDENLQNPEDCIFAKEICQLADGFKLADKIYVCKMCSDIYSKGLCTLPYNRRCPYITKHIDGASNQYDDHHFPGGGYGQAAR